MKAFLRRRPILAIKDILKESKKLIDDAGRCKGERIDEEVDDLFIVAILWGWLDGFWVIVVVLFLLDCQGFHFLEDAKAYCWIKLVAIGCLGDYPGREEQNLGVEYVVVDCEELLFYGNGFA